MLNMHVVKLFLRVKIFYFASSFNHGDNFNVELDSPAEVVL